MRKFLIVLAASCLFSIQSLAEVSVPRPEYPRPQFERAEWINLNGEWSYCFDFSGSGVERKLYESSGFDGKIVVPFAPQSELSGVGFRDFIPEMWYQREFVVPSGWADRRVMLNFGAVDYIATVYVDGQLAGRHWGGSSSFSIDITALAAPGEKHSLVVRVEDDERCGEYPIGKQASVYESHMWRYARTTGIWQTVWLEPVAATGLKDVYIIPDPDQDRFILEPKFCSVAVGQKLRVRVSDGDETVCERIVPASDQSRFDLPLDRVRMWSPEDPFLYGVELDVLSAEGAVIDHVESYSGLRKITVVGNRIYLNDEPVYLRMVLDQGFYQDGLWTAPSDEALRNDIELALAAGFNSARLHQKVFEPRFHYWADRLGYLTWGEFPSWGADINRPGTARNFLPEWEEVVIRDRNHPSIITWTPLNEAWWQPVDREQARETIRFTTDLYNLTKALDYRPFHDASGGLHVITDIFSVHSYQKDPEKLRQLLVPGEGKVASKDPRRDAEYSGQPYLIDEYGGFGWNENGDNERIYNALEALTDAILSLSDCVCGYCYCQLTDVDAERNGFCTWDRQPKTYLDMDRIRTIFSKVPDGYR